MFLIRHVSIAGAHTKYNRVYEPNYMFILTTT